MNRGIVGKCQAKSLANIAVTSTATNLEREVFIGADPIAFNGLKFRNCILKFSFVGVQDIGPVHTMDHRRSSKVAHIQLVLVKWA